MRGASGQSRDREAGPALASAGPDWKHFCVALLSDV